VLTAGWLPYFKEKKAWAGYNSVNEYLNPKQQRESAAGHWYTNLPINDRPKYKNLKIMPLSKIPDHCKAFDDAGMLVVRNGYIPSNYDHPFAVSNRPILNGLLEKGYEIVQDKEYDPYFDGKRHFAKVLVQKNDKNTN
jgi:hypothetical protein